MWRQTGPLAGKNVIRGWEKDPIRRRSTSPMVPLSMAMRIVGPEGPSFPFFAWSAER